MPSKALKGSGNQNQEPQKIWFASVVGFGDERMSSFVLLDTNILIGILNGSERSSEILGLKDAAISVVTVMELYALAGISDAEASEIEKFLQTRVIFPVTAPIARRAGVLARTRRRGRPDLLIAATAIEYRLQLFTRNTKDFVRIPGLSLFKI